jgi:hypothetical protein
MSLIYLEGTPWIRVLRPPTNTGIPPCSVVHQLRCMRAIGLVAMFHVEPSRVGRDGRLMVKRSVYISKGLPFACRSNFGHTSICFPKALGFRKRFLSHPRIGDAGGAKLILVSILLYVAACTVTNGLAGRGTECILYVPRPLKVEQDPTPYYPDASKRAKETGEVILHFRIGVDGVAKSRSL